MSPPGPSYSTSAGPQYFNTAEEQEKDLNISYMKMTQVLKEEIKKPLKKSWKRYTQIHLEDISKSLKESQKSTNKQLKKIKNPLKGAKKKTTTNN